MKKPKKFRTLAQQKADRERDRLEAMGLRLAWGMDNRMAVHDAIVSLKRDYPMDTRIETILNGFASQQMVLDLQMAELQKLNPRKFKK